MRRSPVSGGHTGHLPRISSLSLKCPSLAQSQPAPVSYISAPDLPPGVRLVHKTRHGYVDLQFHRMGKRLQPLRGWCGNHLKPGMTLQRASGSAVIRVKVPRISTSDGLDQQAEEATQALSTARSLLAWYLSLPTKSGDGDEEFRPSERSRVRLHPFFRARS
jgi:hypothetical protein